MGEAAEFLGIAAPDRIQQSRIYSGAAHVHSWAKNQLDPRAFEAALRALATELDAAPDLVDYRRRRTALQDWCLDLETWHDLITRLPPTPGPIKPELGDRKRQCASEVVWVYVTQGEHHFAPRPIEEQQPPDIRRAWKRRRDTTWFNFQTDRPKRHYADLKRLLDAYANQLAARIDRAAATASDRWSTRRPPTPGVSDSRARASISSGTSSSVSDQDGA